MRRLVTLLLCAAPAIARADTPPAAPPSGSDGSATFTDDEDDDDANRVTSPGEDEVRSPAHDDDDEGSGGEGDVAAHGNGEASPETEDANEHAHDGHIHHEPGRELELVTPDARLRVGLALEPLARYGHDSVVPNDTLDLVVHRARLALDAELAHGVGVRLELQVRDNVIGLADAYGRWALDEHLEIQAGFLGTPQGLERDTYALDLPFANRSALAAMTYDRELGVKIVGHQSDTFWAISVSRDAPLGLGGDDPVITPAYPPGITASSLERDTSSWNQAARIGVAPSADFEASIDWTLRFRGDPDLGDPAYEPNGTVFLDARPYKGLSARIGGDAALSEEHFRVLGEVMLRHDGDQLSIDPATGTQTDLQGHEWWAGGYLTLGISPDGRYGAAVDGAPLQWGWEILARFEAMQVKPVDAFAAHYYGWTLGWDWVPTRQFRIEADLMLQSFGDFDHTILDDNAGATRFYAEVFALWRM
ncbi:MAG TPA: hypothetical protein VGL61_30940 [Kofleriaceae bacterium]|jgi:hypothetical protein